MSEHLTDADVQAILERADAAPKGPWLVERRFSNEVEVAPHVYGPQRWIASIPGAPAPGINLDTMPIAEFVAATRSDVPALCREVLRLREDNLHLSMQTPEERELDIRNDATDTLAAMMLTICEEGSLPGTFGGEKIERLAQAIAALRSQRDELLAALKILRAVTLKAWLYRGYGEGPLSEPATKIVLDDTEAVIAAVEQGASGEGKP